MNKLASIDYVAGLGLPTTFPRIITSKKDSEIIKAVDKFYYNYHLGWVLRCGELPDIKARLEGALPWDINYSKEELVRKTLEFQKEIGNRYYVFCHEQADMIRGGVMLIEGNSVLVEAATGNPKELSAMFRGRRNPEQSVLFNPGMFSFKDSGKEVLTLEDMKELRGTERSIIWQDIDALSQPVSVEFSRLRGGEFYVHDIGVMN